MPAATMSAWPSVVRSTSSSARPSACAVRPVVPMRRKFMLKNMMPNTAPASATPASGVGVSRWPSTPASTIDSSGTEMLEITIGSASCQTRRLVMP